LKVLASNDLSTSKPLLLISDTVTHFNNTSLFLVIPLNDNNLTGSVLTSV
jgi:hypothetical protein